MNIFLFSTQWPEYMIQLANALCKHGKITLMLPDNHRLTPNHINLISKKITFVPYKVIFHKSIRDNFKMLSIIIRTIRKCNPDILHIQANGHRLFYWVAIFKPLKTKIINTIHDPKKHIGDIPSLTISDYWVKTILKYYTFKYIVHGNSLIPVLSKEYSVSTKKIISIPHGNLNIYKAFQKKVVNETPDTILFFGRIWKYKGLNYFIEAANIIHRMDKNVKFIIAGTGDNLKNYTKHIQNIDSFEILNERISLEDAGMIFQKSSIVVLPYIEASQSGVIPLAYSYGKPVIATRVGGLPDVIKEGETGYIVEPRNPKKIADIIVSLLNDPQLRNEISRNALDYANSELSWKYIAIKTFDIYNL